MVVEKLNQNSESVLKARYYLNEKEDWPGLCHRVVDNVIPVSCSKYNYEDTEVQELLDKCFMLINNLYFLPNSPTMFNAGTEYPMLSACFIIGVEDDLEEIYESVKESAKIHKLGGGVGFSLSNLRCNGSRIATTHGHSRGAVSFLKVFAYGTAEITAAGKRKGANMAMLDVGHADVEEYISCKSTEGELSNFNISVQLTDKFMEACKNNEDFDLIDPKDGSVVKTIKALDLMKKIAYGAWWNGEPGICFIDTINKENPVPHLGKITSSNPCGEFYNIPYNSCNLGSINLTKYVKEDKTFDWDLFREHVGYYVLYLDCIIDANQYPLEKITDITTRTRPLGLGVMGFADTLIMMGIKYNSDEGFSFAAELSEKLSYYSLEASAGLAKVRGPYAEFRKENHRYEKAKKFGKLDWEALCSKIDKHGLRNSHTVVIAPTGTIARIANEVSFGIEPIFALEYTSNILNGNSLTTRNYLHEKLLSGELDVSEDVFVCAKDISWQDHIKMQAEWQKFVHNGISKTINMPENTSVEDVYSAYMMAYELGLKGLTVYISGSRKNEVLVDKEREVQTNTLFSYHSAPKRPEILECDIHHMQVQGQKWIALVGLLDGNPYEIFAGLSKYIDLNKKYEKGIIVKRSYKTKHSEYDLVVKDGEEEVIRIRNIVETFSNENEGVLGRLISLSLRHGSKPAHLSDQLLKDPSPDFTTYSKTLGRVLKKYIHNGEKPETGSFCPECETELIYVEGCKSCPKCFWAKCS